MIHGKALWKRWQMLAMVVLLLTMGSPVPLQAAAVQLNKTEVTVSKGNTVKLKLTGNSGSRKTEWSSSDKKIASVNGNGKVTAKKAGTVVIKVKVGKKTLKCRVTVEPKKEQSTEPAEKPENGSPGLSEKAVYNAMIALKKQYPEGTRWTNDRFYKWKGNGGFYGGYGCAAFAFRLSDAAFGNLPARMHDKFGKVRVGDIIRMEQDTHSVIVLEVNAGGVIVAEGNYNESVHWGRSIPKSEIKRTGTYVLTRYPK